MCANEGEMVNKSVLNKKTCNQFSQLKQMTNCK